MQLLCFRQPLKAESVDRREDAAPLLLERAWNQRRGVKTHEVAGLPITEARDVRCNVRRPRIFRPSEAALGEKQLAADREVQVTTLQKYEPVTVPIKFSNAAAGDLT